MKKKNHIKVRFSTILLCISAILLCAAPCGWADGSYFYDGDTYDLDDGEIYDVTEDLVWLEVGAGTTVNLRCASVELYVFAYPGSILNIYSGNVGVGWYVLVKPAMATGSSEPEAVVTVYGSGFKVDGDSVNYGPIVIDNLLSTGTYGGILTGIYENLKPIELKFVSTAPVLILLEPPAVSNVEIDIKPGGNPNNINLRSKGVVPVAILSTETFNASNVDPESVTFAGAEPVRCTLCDVDGDDNEDMLFHFKTQELNLDENSTEATLTLMGQTLDGNAIQGTDDVRIVQRKK